MEAVKKQKEIKEYLKSLRNSQRNTHENEMDKLKGPNGLLPPPNFNKKQVASDKNEKTNQPFSSDQSAENKLRRTEGTLETGGTTLSESVKPITEFEDDGIIPAEN